DRSYGTLFYKSCREIDLMERYSINRAVRSILWIVNLNIVLGDNLVERKSKNHTMRSILWNVILYIGPRDRSYGTLFYKSGHEIDLVERYSINRAMRSILWNVILKIGPQDRSYGTLF